MQEKVSAIIPVNSTDKKIVSKLKDTNHHVQLLKNTSKNQINIQSSILDELALSVQNSMDIDLSGAKKVVTKAIKINTIEVDSNGIDNNWIEFTKSDEILETAKQYLGVKYIWAANGPFAFDCSGYTKYVFRENGITIPRYSGHQANVGTKVTFNELEKGDLVFFDTAKGFHGKVNHVGIYIGENRFIHASSARKQVMITSFSQKKFYKNRFLHGRRVVDSDASFAFYKK
jgi:cell wall-associated NlpC family hydrolase